MMKRATWFVGGIVTGAAAAGYGARKVKRTAAQLTPVAIARGALDRAKGRARTVTDALREGRHAMNLREDELKARRDGRLQSLSDHVGPDDQVLVDGRPVEPGRVIVMRRSQ